MATETKRRRRSQAQRRADWEAEKARLLPLRLPDELSSRAARWIENNGKQVSPFGGQVAAVLGCTFQGIYHIGRDVLRADWSDDRCVRVNLTDCRSLATFDAGYLTTLVILAHDACIRLDIEAVAPHTLRLQFSPRSCRIGDFSERHPTMEQAIATLRERSLYDYFDATKGRQKKTP